MKNKNKTQSSYKKLRDSKIYCVVDELAQRSSKDRVTVSAAALSFHGVLAFFPAVVSLIGILHLMGLNSKNTETVVHYITLILPAQAATVVTGAIKTREATGASTLEVILGTIVALWSLTGAIASMQVGLDLAYEIPKDRSFIKRRLSSVPLVGVSLLFILAIFIDLIGGTFLIRHITSIDSGVTFGFLGGILDIARLIVAIMLALILLSVYYSFGSAKKTPIKDFFNIKTLFSYGSLVAVVAWVISLFGFSLYLTHFSNTTKTYGLFGSIIVMMLWLYITSYFLFLGAEMNARMSDQ